MVKGKAYPTVGFKSHFLGSREQLKMFKKKMS